MANEDEICCRCFLPIHRDDSRDYLGDRIAHKSERCIYLLAAALREAREELGVLRSKAMQLDVGNAVKAAIRESNAEIAALDAAMKPPGGEDGA